MAGLSRRRLLGGSSAAVGLAIWSLAPEVKAADDAPKGTPEARRTMHVGSSRSIRTLREAANMARDGDLVLVDAGEYRGDVAVWSQRDLVIRANGAGALLVASGASADDKGTFVFRGATALVDNFRFFGARARDGNGAGIRLDPGARVTISRCHFEDNENGVLTSNDAQSELDIVDSVFVGNGAGDGQTHNLYVGAIGRLTVTGCYSARSRVGHLLKTRARENVIGYSRFSGEEGTSSYELEFPSGGRAVVVGCLIQQGPSSDNSTIVSYGAEGSRWPQNELLLSFCTIVNDRSRGGVFFRVATDAARVELVDNLLVGPGQMALKGSTPVVRNVVAKRSDFADAVQLDYRLRRSSGHIGAAGLAGNLGPGRVRPAREYVHPAHSVELGRYSPISPLSPGAFQRIAS